MIEAINNLEQYANEVWDEIQWLIIESDGVYNSHVLYLQRRWFEITQCISKLKDEEQGIK